MYIPAGGSGDTSSWARPFRVPAALAGARQRRHPGNAREGANVPQGAGAALAAEQGRTSNPEKITISNSIRLKMRRELTVLRFLYSIGLMRLMPSGQQSIYFRLRRNECSGETVNFMHLKGWFMSVAELRSEIELFLGQAKDESFLKAVYAMLNTYVSEKVEGPVIGYDVDGTPIHASALGEELDKEVEAAREGNYITAEELENRSKKWMEGTW